MLVLVAMILAASPGGLNLLRFQAKNGGPDCKVSSVQMRLEAKKHLKKFI